MKTNHMFASFLIMICLLFLAGCSFADSDTDGGFVRESYTGIVESLISDENGEYYQINIGEDEIIDFLITDSSEVDENTAISDGDSVKIDCVHRYDTNTYEVLNLTVVDEVRFGDRWIDRDSLSEETLEWLDWYNSLSEEEQLVISAIPADLLDESEIVGTEDAEAITD